MGPIGGGGGEVVVQVLGGGVTSIVTCVVLELVSLTPHCKEGIFSLGSWISAELM